MFEIIIYTNIYRFSICSNTKIIKQHSYYVIQSLKRIVYVYFLCV